jgi:anti-anti-sigma factor
LGQSPESIFQEVWGVEINIKNGDGEVTVELSGRLDANTSPLLQKAFDEMDKEMDKEMNKEMGKEVDKDCRRVILDFASVDYISSAGLRVLLILQKKIAASKGSLTVKNLRGAVREVFDMTGFSAIFKI